MTTWIAVLILVVSVMQPQAGSSAETLRALQQQLAKAWVEGDRAAIERIISPEWSVTGPDGARSTRADVLRDAFETRVHRVIAIDIDDVEVRIFGDAAVVTGRTHGRGEYSGVPYDVGIRFTDTFIRRDGRWQAVASHASVIPK
jgi:ketosteroid isomerase-like protein